MKIAFVGPFGLQPKGTMSVRALPLAGALARRGHEVTLLIPPWDDPARAGLAWVENGVRVVNLPLPDATAGLFHLALARTLVHRILALRPQIVHFFKPKAFAGLAHWACRHLRRMGRLPARLVVDSDDWEQAWNRVLPYHPLQKALFARQERWGLAQADTVTVASRALCDLVAGYRSGGIYYLPNGFRPDSGPATVSANQVRRQWKLGEAPVVLLYSRFLEFRLERIVSLVKQVAAQVPQARWLIVGRGLSGEEQRLGQKLFQAGLEPFVRFAGWVPSGELPAYFEVANLAAFPYDDTLINRTKCSVKLTDLLRAGVPVVADAVGQNRAYIEDGVSGRLTPPEDDAAFGRELVSLLTAPELRQRLGRAAADRMQRQFDWSVLAEIAEQAYNCRD